MITKEEYIEYANNGFNIVPLVKSIDANFDSPINLYSNIKNKKDTFLLESIEGGVRWAQYSIIGLDCTDTIKVTGNKIDIKTDSISNSIESSDPLNELNKIINNFQSPDIENMPRFYGGYVGFFAYESAQYAEAKIRSLQKKDSKFDEHMPDIYLVKSEKLIVYDNFDKSIKVIYNSDPLKIPYEEAIKQLNEIENSIDFLAECNHPSYSDITGELEFESNFTKNEFISCVNKIKDFVLY